MITDFDDPFPVYNDLAKEASNPKANRYEVTATWDMYPITTRGRYGTKEEKQRTFFKGERDRKNDLLFPSYIDNEVTYDFCEDNQKIENLKASKSIARKVVDRTIYEFHLKVMTGIEGDNSNE